MTLDSPFGLRSSGFARCLLALVVGTSIASWCSAASNGTIDQPVVRVEEDWELLVLDPEPNMAAPQVVASMVPDSSNNDVLFSFLVNHGTLPDDSLGGMQVQGWNGDASLHAPKIGEDVLGWKMESVTWTQRLRVHEGNAYFSISHFDSASLGNYEDNENLRLSMPSNLVDLSNYSYGDSLANSVVSFSSNRVHSLRLLRVRYYSSEGLLHEVEVNQGVGGG